MAGIRAGGNYQIILINDKKEAKVFDSEMMSIFHIFWLGYNQIDKETTRMPDRIKEVAEEIADFMDWSLEDD